MDWKDYDWGPPESGGRNGYFKLSARHPRLDDTQWDVLIPVRRKLECKGDPWRARELIETVRSSLVNPHAIFVGIRNPWDAEQKLEDEERFRYGLCYVSRPAYRYVHRAGPLGSENGYEAVHPHGKVFCIFLNSSRIVIKWNWDLSSDEDSMLPRGFKDRFADRII